MSTTTAATTRDSAARKRGGKQFCRSAERSLPGRRVFWNYCPECGADVAESRVRWRRTQDYESSFTSGVSGDSSAWSATSSSSSAGSCWRGEAEGRPCSTMQKLIREYHRDLDRLVAERLAPPYAVICGESLALDTAAEQIAEDVCNNALRRLVAKILYKVTHDAEHFHRIMLHLANEEKILSPAQARVVERSVRYSGVRATLALIELNRLFA